MKTPTLEEMKENDTEMLLDRLMEIDNGNGDPSWHNHARETIARPLLMEIITTAKREALREVITFVEKTIQEERYSGAPHALNLIITHLESELITPQPKD